MILKPIPNLPQPLQLKIQALQSEEDAYAADELVELGEEILSQLAAMGIAAYLKQAEQKEVFNDFLNSLFFDTQKWSIRVCNENLSYCRGQTSLS